MFSSPFSGTFFQYGASFFKVEIGIVVFVPFFGDFFSICNVRSSKKLRTSSFRPLFRGLFFNNKLESSFDLCVVFVPFFGDFFSMITIDLMKL